MNNNKRKDERGAEVSDVAASETAAEYPAVSLDAASRLRAVNETLLSILQETSTSEGVDFFRLLLKKLADTLGFRYAMVAEVVDEERSRARSLAFFADGQIAENMEYDLDGSPCYEVLGTGLRIYQDKARELFPQDQCFIDLEIESYIGIPLVDSKGVVLGILNAFDVNRIEDVEFCRTIFTVFALRVGFELERLRFESERRQSTELHEAVMDNSNAAIYVKDSEGRLLFANRRLLSLFNDKQVIGLTDHDILPKELADSCRESDILTLESGSPQTFEESLRHADGTEQIFLTVKFPLPSMPGAICGISTDITERRKMEGELVRAKKLESIGTLAGGIAHEFNNVLLGVLGNASMAKAYLKSDHKVWSLLDDIERAAERAKIVTRQLLTFSRGDVMIKEIVEVGPLVYSTSKILLGEHDIELKADLPEGLWGVEVDETMIGQAVEHIMLNAVHSMPEGGIVELRGSNVTVTEGEVPPLEPGKYVKIDIVDHGTGIPEENLPQLFDPFFTTKERASGLGLAVAYSVVRKHGGCITVESKVAKGSVFSLYLPGMEIVAEQHKQGVDRVRQEGRVLVMDDEDIIRDVSGEMLKLLGFEVDFALDGVEAIKLYKAAKESGVPYRAVIMDLTIPNGMDGKEAIGELIRFDPDAKVVVSSGYSRDPIMANFTEHGFSAVLVKPYRFDEFSRVVLSVVGEQ
jgi:PAS domain S-box-containing protein